MTTPEGKVKDAIKDFLFLRKCASMPRPCADAVGYYRMHVPNGYGAPEVDFNGTYKGRSFYIEAKAYGNKPSARQDLLRKMHQDALAFSIWGDDAADICKRLGEFFDWVDTIA